MTDPSEAALLALLDRLAGEGYGLHSPTVQAALTLHLREALAAERDACAEACLAVAAGERTREGRGAAAECAARVTAGPEHLDRG